MRISDWSSDVCSSDLIYPEELKRRVRDRLAFQGAQRICSLGAATMMYIAGPQDGIEPLRRICKLILEEETDPEVFEAGHYARSDDREQRSSSVMTQLPPSEWYKTVISLGDAWEWIGQPSHRRQHPTNSRVTATPPMCCCSSASPTRSILAIACSSERCRSPCVLSSVLAISNWG